MTAVYRLRPDLRLTELEGEGVVLHLGTRQYFSVSQTGLTIMEALSQPRTLEQLVQAVLDQYEVAREQAERDTRAFVEMCVARELLVVEDQS